MTPNDKKETMNIVIEALNQVVIPQFDNVYKEIAKSEQRLRKEMKEGFENVKYELRADFKFELDKVRSEIKDLKKELNQIKQMLSEEVEAAYTDMEKFGKRLKSLEEKVKILELMRK